MEREKPTRRSIELEAIDVDMVTIEPSAVREQIGVCERLLGLLACRRHRSTYMGIGRRRVPGSRSLALAFCKSAGQQRSVAERRGIFYLNPPRLSLPVNPSGTRGRINVRAIGIFKNDVG